MPADTPLDALSFQDDLLFPDAGLDAVFYPTAVLLEVVGEDSASEESRTLAAAELLARHFFLAGTDADVQRAMAGFLGSSVLDRFSRRARNFADNAADVRPEDVLRTLSGARGERSLCDRLRPVLRADGFIPLRIDGVEGRTACLLPFSFEPCDLEDDAGTVLDWRGFAHKAWTDLLHNRLAGLFVRHKNPYRIRLAFVVEGRFATIPLDGESLLLPVRLAWARFRGELPKYSVFRLLATGEIAPNGDLRRVETAAKKNLVRSIPGAHLLAPDAGAEESQDHSDVIPEGESVRDRLPASIVERIEEWFVSDWKYAVARLADQGLVSEINHGRYGHWTQMIDRLENLLAPLAGDDRKERLLTEMWLGQACCHAALTEKAMVHNRMAHGLASGAPEFRYELQRLDVEMIVNLTDMEAFDEVCDLSAALKRELREENWTDREQQADLSMRWHGSLGQALAYGTLDGRPGFSKEAAKAALDAALSDAVRRKKIRLEEESEADVSESEADIVQDANYVHLWYALFDPSSRAAADAYTDAKMKRGRLEAQSAARRKNEVFQLRQLSFAAYRRLLSGENAGIVSVETFRLESEDTFFNLVDDDDAERWLRATVAKYLGALAAARGESSDGRGLFEKAFFWIGDGGRDPVARKIAMTVRAEAFRSLRGLFPEEAARYRKEAKELLVGIPDRDNRWKIWLESPDAAPFPGLSYWY